MSTVACRDMAPALSSLIDGRLRSPEASAAREHMARCDACRAELESLTALRAGLAGLSAPEPRADALERLRTRVVGRSPRSRIIPVAAGLGAAVVSVALLATAAMGLLRSRSGHPPSVAAASVTVQAEADATLPVAPEPKPQTIAASADVPAKPKYRRPARRPRRQKRAQPSPPPEDRGSLILVSITDPTPPRPPEPAPGTTLTLGEVTGRDGRPGAQFAVLRTVGLTHAVESIELAYYGTEIPAPVEPDGNTLIAPQEHTDDPANDRPLGNESDAGDGDVGDGDRAPDGAV